jgi:hypothetical protein
MVDAVYADRFPELKREIHPDEQALRARAGRQGERVFDQFNQQMAGPMLVGLGTVTNVATPAGRLQPRMTEKAREEVKSPPRAKSDAAS